MSQSEEHTERPNRFAHLADQMQGVKLEQGTDRRSLAARLSKTEEQDDVMSAEQVQLEKTELYQILIDPDLDEAEKVERIAALLRFNQEDLESNPEIIAQSKALISQLMQDFKDYNVNAMNLVHDSPLSSLASDIQEVFGKYHELIAGRSDLDDKLALIDEVLGKHGGPEGLVKALHSAKDKEAEHAQMREDLEAEGLRIKNMGADLSDLRGEISVLRASLSEAEGDRFLFIKSAKKAQIRADQRELRRKSAKLDTDGEALDMARKGLKKQAAAYEAFMEGEDFLLHKKILEILEMGSEDFKEKIRLLAQLTIGHIEDTERILDGSETQLKDLLERSQHLLTMIQNTGEQVNILLRAQTLAQDSNTTTYQKLNAEAENLEGIDRMKHGKVMTALNTHVTSIDHATKSTTLVSSSLSQMETGQITFVNRLHEGLADAEEQKMLSMGNASMTGVATLSRIESIAAAIPGLIAKGQYRQDSEHAFKELSKEFERALSAKIAGNAGIENFTSALRELRESMQERNDLDVDITTQRKALIDTMIEETERLAGANADAQAIESSVNEMLYGEDSEELDPDKKEATKTGDEPQASPG